MEYALLGAVATLILTENKPRIDMKARAKVCHALQEVYTRDQFPQRLFNSCIEYGPEDTLRRYPHLKLQKKDK